MGARGRRGLIVGLEDLAKGVVLASEMKRRALSDALERERFEYEKSLRDAQLKEEAAYHEGLISDKRAARSAEAQKYAQKQRETLLEGIQRGRISKNLEGGNARRAARIAFNRGIALPEHTVKLFSPDDPSELTPFKLWLRDNPNGTYEEYVKAGWRPYKESSGGAGTGSSALDKAIDLRNATVGLSKVIAAEKPKAINLDKLVAANRSLTPLEPEPAPAERFMPEASRYTGASDLPMGPPKPTSQEARDSALDSFIDNDIIARTAMTPEEQEELRAGIYASALYQYLLGATPENYARMTARVRSEGPALFGSWNPKAEFSR